MTQVKKEHYKELCRRLIQARYDAEMTQIEVADAMGKTQSYISKCESGMRRLDAIELAHLAKLYDKPIRFFLDHIHH